MKTAEEILWSRVDRSGVCWVWTGTLTPDGYGQFTLARKHYHAHRLAYELLVGPIPTGYQIDHICRNPPCVNPDHLEAVPPKENNLRGLSPAALNSVKTECKYGHPLYGTNLVIFSGTRQCRECRLRRTREWKRGRRNA